MPTPHAEDSIAINFCRHNIVKCNRCGLSRNTDTAHDCPVCVNDWQHMTMKLLRRVAKTGYRPKQTRKERTLYMPIEPIIPFSLQEYLNSLNFPNLKGRDIETLYLKVKAIICLRDNFLLSFNRISKLFGYCDHTTPMLLYKKYHQQYVETQNKINSVEKEN